MLKVISADSIKGWGSVNSLGWGLAESGNGCAVRGSVKERTKEKFPVPDRESNRYLPLTWRLLQPLSHWDWVFVIVGLIPLAARSFSRTCAKLAQKFASSFSNS